MLTAAEVLAEKHQELVTVSPDATVLEAVHNMTTHKVGCVLVFDGGQLVGLWTERDLLRQTAQSGFDPVTARMRDHMIRDLVFTPDTDTIYELADKILGRRHRRLLICHEGTFVGLLTQGDVMRAFMRAKSREIEDLNEIVSWEYYEEWHWAKESGKTKLIQAKSHAFAHA